MTEPASPLPPIPMQPLPPWRTVAGRLLILSLPIIGSMLGRAVMSFADFAMVSRLGTEAQAGIMPAGMIIFATCGFGIGALTAVNTYASQCFGRREYSQASAYAWQGVWWSLLMGMMILPTWFGIPKLFAMIGHEPGVQAVEVTYTQIMLVHIAPALVVTAVTNFFNGIHRPMIGLVVTLIGNAVNLVLNYMLIFGHWGAPRMEVAGAAWATTISTVLQAVLLIGWMMLPYYRQTFATHLTWRPHVKRAIKLVRIGLPSGVQLGADILAWTIFTVILVGQFGKVQMAANNIAFKFLELSFMPALGLGFGLSAAVGKCIGERQPHLARRYASCSLIITMMYMGAIGCAMVLLRRPFYELFTQDPEVIQWGMKIMLLCAVFQLFDAMGLTFSNALRGAGDTTWPAVLTITQAGTLFIGGGWLISHLHPEYGVVGPWLMGTAHLCILSIVLCLRFLFGPWERIDLHGDANEPGTGHSAAEAPFAPAGSIELTPEATALSIDDATAAGVASGRYDHEQRQPVAAGHHDLNAHESGDDLSESTDTQDAKP